MILRDDLMNAMYVLVSLEGLPWRGHLFMRSDVFCNVGYDHPIPNAHTPSGFGGLMGVMLASDGCRSQECKLRDHSLRAMFG